MKGLWRVDRQHEMTETKVEQSSPTKGHVGQLKVMVIWITLSAAASHLVKLLVALEEGLKKNEEIPLLAIISCL